MKLLFAVTPTINLSWFLTHPTWTSINMAALHAYFAFWDNFQQQHTQKSGYIMSKLNVSHFHREKPKKIRILHRRDLIGHRKGKLTSVIWKKISPLACRKWWWWSDGQFSGRNIFPRFSSGCDETWRWTGWRRFTSVWHWNKDRQQQRGEVWTSDSNEIIASPRFLSNLISLTVNRSGRERVHRLWVSSSLPAPLINMSSAWPGIESHQSLVCF